MNRTIRLLLISGNKDMKKELSCKLGNEGTITIVGEAEGSEEGLREARQLLPDVILLLITDEHMTAMNGLNTIADISQAKLPASLIVITENIGRYLIPAIKAGVAGLLPWNIIPGELSSAIRKIYLWSYSAS